jgi:uncharacterized membrane protein YbaN (DUF454 family)
MWMMSVAKSILVLLGSLCVGLAVVGMFVPILPTTPFLLLAAYLFARSSVRFYDWLITNKWFGPYIRNYREGHGIPFVHKIITIGLLWLTIGVTCYFLDSNWVKLVLFGVACGVTYHLARTKTYRSALIIHDED